MKKIGIILLLVILLVTLTGCHYAAYPQIKITYQGQWPSDEFYLYNNALRLQSVERVDEKTVTLHFKEVDVE